MSISRFAKIAFLTFFTIFYFSNPLAEKQCRQNLVSNSQFCYLKSQLSQLDIGFLVTRQTSLWQAQVATSSVAIFNLNVSLQWFQSGIIWDASLKINETWSRFALMVNTLSGKYRRGKVSPPSQNFVTFPRQNILPLFQKFIIWIKKFKIQN